MLDAAGLSAGYGGMTAVSGVDLAVAAGERLAVVGRNGAGKTTLLKALMGLASARAERLSLAGRDLRAAPAHARGRAGMAWVPQGRGVFSALTVRENLLLGALGGRTAGRRDAARAAAEAVARVPAVAPLLDRPGGRLSGGERQAVALARALSARPLLLLLDEPTEGLQPSAVDALADTLRGLAAGGLAVLLVEQNREFAARAAGRAAVMERGRLAAAA